MGRMGPRVVVAVRALGAVALAAVAAGAVADRVGAIAGEVTTTDTACLVQIPCE